MTNKWLQQEAQAVLDVIENRHSIFSLYAFHCAGPSYISAVSLSERSA